MPECCAVEETTKCRFLFYEKATGDVLDVGSGGGAGEALTGNAFIIWRFNDITAPSRIGCIPYYFNALGMTTKPVNIDIAYASDYEAKSRAWRAAKTNGDVTVTHEAFEALCIVQTACLSFRPSDPDPTPTVRSG